MEDECIFCNPVQCNCIKYSVICHGSVYDKKSCPVWGKVLAYENYLEEKLTLDREFMENADNFF